MAPSILHSRGKTRAVDFDNNEDGMNLIELDQHLEALTGYLRRQGGQSIVPGTSKWRSYRVCELVEAVEVARQRIKKTKQEN